MVRLLADENFSGDALRGLFRRKPDLDLLRVQDVGLSGADDHAVLTWAAENDRIILTQDRATMPSYALERVGMGEAMPGLFILNDRLPVRDAIGEILLIAECSTQEEWSGLAVYLPL